MEMGIYQWLMLALVALGFIGTWVMGAFTLGRAVEQMKASLRGDIHQERDKILQKIGNIEERFDSDQKTQDHNFGEVGASVRQYIADVEKKVREVEIYGRDNYVKIPDFEKAMDRLSSDLKLFAADIKKDFHDRLADLRGQLKS